MDATSPRGYRRIVRLAGCAVAGLGLSATDVAHLRDVVELASTAPPGPATMRQVLEGLQHLIGCDSAACFSMDVVTRREGYVQEVASGEQVLVHPGKLADIAIRENEDPFYDLLPERSFRMRDVGSGLPVVQSISQFLTPLEWRKDPMRALLEAYDDHDRALGLFEITSLDDSMMAAYPVGTGRTRRIVLRRHHGRFGDRERFLLRLVRPHLDQQVRATAVMPDSPAQSLSARQYEVLQLVRTGLANKQIARVLGIAEGTVRKHLEHVYAQLGVQSRTAAVAALADRADG